MVKIDGSEILGGGGEQPSGPMREAASTGASGGEARLGGTR